MFIVDAHLDLAYNALQKGRDPRRRLTDIRAAEAPEYLRGIPTVSFSAMRRGGVGLVFSTIFSSPQNDPFPDGSDEDERYSTPDEAHRLGMKQIDFYRRVVDEDETLRLVTDVASLDEVVASHADGPEARPLLGLLLLMEGADHIRTPEETELWRDAGVRVIGPAWDDTRYCDGAWRGSKQGLSPDGRRLLEVMADLNLILDLTHMSEIAALQSLDSYTGPVVATHANARALVPTERQLGDKQIRLIGERDGVIGCVLFNAFLRAGYRKGDSKALVTLDTVVAHIDHVCQLIGDARHAGIGSDLDGGFGAADIPTPLDSIADLGLIGDALRQRGYSEEDVAGIMGGNWVGLLRRTLS
jgi:membrane dipeptidase